MAIEEAEIRNPGWLDALLASVAVCLRPLNPIAELGCRYEAPDSQGVHGDTWVVAVYPLSNEISGGPDDGDLALPGFSFDVSKFLASVSGVETVTWHSSTDYATALEGPELSIRGMFEERRVWLRLFALSPCWEDPAAVINNFDGSLRRSFKPGTTLS